MKNQKLSAIGTIVVIIVLILFVYPSTDNLINAGQTKYKQEIPALTSAHMIAVSSNEVIAHYFGKDVVEKIMKQSGCVGVRMYYGKKVNGKSGIMIVGFDKYGKNLEQVVIAGPAAFCPPVCND